MNKTDEIKVLKKMRNKALDTGSMTAPFDAKIAELRKEIAEEIMAEAKSNGNPIVECASSNMEEYYKGEYAFYKLAYINSIIEGLDSFTNLLNVCQKKIEEAKSDNAKRTGGQSVRLVGSIRQKGKNSWQIQIYTDGKHRYFETIRGTLENAEERLRELNNEGIKRERPSRKVLQEELREIKTLLVRREEEFAAYLQGGYARR